MTDSHVAALKLKICGTATVTDAAMLNGTVVDYCGILVDVAFSPRSVSLAQARDIAAAFDGQVVILLCNPSLQLCAQVQDAIQPFALQFLCAETPDFLHRLRNVTGAELWKSIHLPWLPAQAAPRAYVEAGADRLLFDAQIRQHGTVRFGGTGHLADWGQVREQVRHLHPVPCFVAGGIHADNVREAVAATAPAGVDLCSGVEAAPGRRDPERLAQLLQQWGAIPQTRKVGV